MFLLKSKKLDFMYCSFNVKTLAVIECTEIPGEIKKCRLLAVGKTDELDLSDDIT